jgi:hypothetical protein
LWDLHVLTIDDAANNFVSSKETDKITHDLDTILHDINTFESHTRNCLSTLETMYKLEKKKAESFWENLIYHIEHFVCITRNFKLKTAITGRGCHLFK